MLQPQAIQVYACHTLRCHVDDLSVTFRLVKQKTHAGLFHFCLYLFIFKYLCEWPYMNLNSVTFGRYGNTFQINVTDWILEHFLWNCFHVHATELHRWCVNTGLGNGFETSGLVPDRYMASLRLDWLMIRYVRYQACDLRLATRLYFMAERIDMVFLRPRVVNWKIYICLCNASSFSFDMFNGILGPSQYKDVLSV